MKWSYDLAGAEPIIRDVPVYAAAAGTLNNGTLLMLGDGDGDSADDKGIAFITAYTSSVAEAVNALGTLNEKTYETGGTAPSRTPVDTSGVYYGKAVINPFAVYRAQYYDGTSDDVAVTTGAATTTVTATNLEDDYDAGWLFFPLASGGAQGKLRAIATSTTSSCTVDSAITTTTSDTFIKIHPVNRRFTDLSSDGKGLTSAAVIGTGVSLHVMENYINSDVHVIQPLRWATHAGLNATSNAKFFADLAMLDHVYNMGD